jgi:hypothetical protein
MMRRTTIALIATTTVLLGLVAVEASASAAAPPTVTGVSPTSGPTAGLTAVSITGTGFTGATGVHFGTMASTLFTVNSDTSITAYSPHEWGSTVDVSVTTAGGTSATSAADQYTYLPSPIFLQLPQGTAFTYIGHSCGGIQEQSVTTGFDPTRGFPLGLVYVSTHCGGSGRGGGPGTYYTAWTSAEWDLTGTLVTSSVATVPPSIDPAFTAFDSHGNEVYNTKVGTAACTTFSTACNFKAYLLLATGFTPLPRLLSVAPTPANSSVTPVPCSGPCLGPSSGGTSVTISGTGFSSATSVDFGLITAASFVVNSDNSITAVSPPEAAGTVDLTVTTAGGTSATSSADQFVFVAAPVITGVSPDSGSTSGGYYVTVGGQNFTHTTGVSVGDVVVPFVVVNDSQLSVYIPASDSGPDGASIIVTTVGGMASTGFTYTAPTGVAPTITSANSVTFAEGIAGSFTVTATGTPASTFSETDPLPTGVTLSSAGVLSGTPTQTGTFPITIYATNGVAPDTSQLFTLTVSPNGVAPVITSANSATFTQGTAGSFQVTATGTPSPTFTETGALPAGVTLSSAGVFLCNTAQSGTFAITIDATNGIAPDDTQSFTLIVNAAAGFQILTSSLPNATPGAGYGPVQLQIAGEAPGAVLKWKKAGPIPHGLKLLGTGLLQGTASIKLLRGATMPVPIRVTEKWISDSGGIRAKHQLTVTKTLTIQIN